MPILKQPISQAIWDMKYRYRRDGEPVEGSIEETWQRVAAAIACAEKPALRDEWQQSFLNILSDFKFMPGGRILAGAGTQHHVTLFNCFVMNIKEDSMTGIFDALHEGALTLQQGGGIGYDFSVLRPAGSIAHGTGLPASGPVSFMQIWDATCGVLLSTGARRGAMMGVLRCDHPDIETFISAKSDEKLLRNFNVSVLVSDEFMQAVKDDADWQLVFPTKPGSENEAVVMRTWCNSAQPLACKVYQTVKARDLWQKIIRYAYDYAEPGVLFGDTINRLNNLSYCEKICATNPCGEIPLPAYGACDLGAVNLTQFVSAPFTQQAKIKWTQLEETVSIATRFLDDVIDVSKYPLLAQEEKAYQTRRIGLGVTGLADAFVMLGVRYGSEESVKLAKEIIQKVSEVTWLTSVELAREKDSFPLFEKEYLQGEFFQKLAPHIKQAVKAFGVRNSHHNTIAPAGTISLLANNISNGIEPIFQAKYSRDVRLPDGTLQQFVVEDYAYSLWINSTPSSPKCESQDVPPAWVDTESLAPKDHLAVQGAMQPFIDNAISKTINLPADFPFEKLKDVYSQAYEMGLKGCTVFRPNPVTGSVLKKDDSACCKVEG